MKPRAQSQSHPVGFAVSEWDDDRRVTTTQTSRVIHYFHFTFLKRSDTCASSAAAFKRTNMKTLAQLTLLLIMSGSAVGQMLKYNVTGYVGMDVLLSCNCSNDPKELIWQKGVRVVNVHPQDKSIIDESYVNRTQLFINKEKRNCSLLLLNISKTDAGLYTCHVPVCVDNDVWSKESIEVNLTVSEMQNHEKNTGGNPVTAVSVSVPILVVMLILAVSLLLTLLIKRHHRRNKDADLPAEKPMLQHV